MGKQKIVGIFNRYMDWLDKVSTHLDNPVKIRNLISSNKKKIILWIYIVSTVLTMITIYFGGECLNCEMLSHEEATKLLTNEDLAAAYVSENVYVSFTSFKTYMRYLIVPLLTTWIINLIFISVIIIIFKLIKLIIRKLGITEDPIIKIPKINRNE
tara:strand:+ start:42 stop:509 length:468 start_codon:yes stop_codon:yes gene_type:complete